MAKKAMVKIQVRPADSQSPSSTGTRSKAVIRVGNHGRLHKSFDDVLSNPSALRNIRKVAKKKTQIRVRAG